MIKCEIVTLICCGLFGGFVYGIQNKRLVLPHRSVKHNHTWNLGVLADLFFGVAGAIAIFLIVPGKFDLKWNTEEFSDFMRSIATAMVGGYGGIALVDRVLNKTIAELNEKVQANEDQQQNDLSALNFITDYFSSDFASEGIDTDEIAKSIGGASKSTRVLVLEEARKYRRQYWQEDKALMEKVIPVLEALAAADTEKEYHRIYGQLAFALKDKNEPDYERAIQNFDLAIKVRKQKRGEGTRLYEFNRAICRIRLDKKYQESNVAAAVDAQQVYDDLRVAYQHSQTAQMILLKNRHGKLSEGAKEAAEASYQEIEKWLMAKGFELHSITGESPQ